MKPQVPTQYSKLEDPLVDAEGIEETSEDDLWFLPGPIEVEPDYLPPGPRAELRETAVLDDWRKAEVVLPPFQRTLRRLRFELR